MNSTDRNLNNPTQKIELELENVVSQFKCPKIIPISRRTYEAMGEHEQAIYTIKEYPYEMYWGDTIVSKGVKDYSKREVPKYLLLYDPVRDEYVIYVTHEIHASLPQFSVDDMDGMSEIERHKDPKIAMDSLKRMTFRGRPNELEDKLYNVLASFISKDINLNTCITGIIGELGFKNTSNFYELIETTMVHGCNDSHYINSLPKRFLSILQELRDKSNSILYLLYDGIYGILLSNNFFKDKKYNLNTHDYIDIREPINKIINLYLTTLIGDKRISC